MSHPLEELLGAVERAAAMLGPLATRAMPLGPLTTYRVGGAAALGVVAAGEEDLSLIHISEPTRPY